MTDFLLELRSEEIPARMQAKAREDLARLFVEHVVRMVGSDLGEPDPNPPVDIITYATPRRLALIARGLPDATEAVSEEVKGPKTSAPDQALEGFLRKTGLTRDQLTERDGTFFAVTEKPGRASADVLAAAIPAIVRQFPWPKSMRWGDASASTESPRWVRPLHGIVALFGDAIVDCEAAGVRSGAVTKGHRFHHPGDITIGSAHDYVEKLRACHVVVDQAERAAIIATGATMLTAGAGLTLIRDEGLLAENAGLTEWPVPLLGRFDAAFLDVPPEVIQLTARVNQKYFVCMDGAGEDAKLANAFVCVANIDAADGGDKIAEGNRKVLAARLSDARFFYETDLKTKLEDLTPKLEKIVFHEKLGTVADKVERVAKLAEWLATEGIVPDCDPALARRAAELCKADLVTGMVGEFPELQGLMGGYYAAAQGEDSAVAAAIRDHYKPVGQGDDVPTAPVTVAVSLADKLDTIAGFFLIRERPTGSKDPFALRRAAIGLIDLTLTNRLRFETMHFFARSIGFYLRQLEKRPEFQTDEWSEGLGRLATADLYGDVTEFVVDRLKVQQRTQGTRHDLIDAVLAVGDDQPVRLLARVRALQGFVGTDDGANLLAGYKRAANILKKEGYAQPQTVTPAKAGVSGDGAQESPEMPASAGMTKISLSYTPEPAESALIAALDGAEPAAADAVVAENFEAAMTALTTLRAPIDAFFDTVTVNDPAPDKREARLALLARVRDAVHAVADFSKIEG